MQALSIEEQGRLEAHVPRLFALGSLSNSSDQIARVVSAPILRALQSGCLFASQKHGGGDSSYYILGHVKYSAPLNTHTLTIEPHTVTELARLESSLSA